MSTPAHPRQRPARLGRDELIAAAIGQVRALSTALDQLDQAAAARFGLNRTDQRSLDVISQAGEISPTELARAIGVSPSAVTTVIDRLENAGYVRRSPARGDRRRTTVAVTPRTEQVGAELFDGLIAAAAAYAQRYSDDQLVAITEFLAHHRATIDALLHARQVPGAPTSS